MGKRRVAVIGLGKLGRRCAEALRGEADLALAGIVRRQPAPVAGLDVPVVGHISELGPLDAALLCVPPDITLGSAREILHRRTPVVECARLHGEAFLTHQAEMQRMAHLYKVRAVVGAGCDPGILSLFRSQLALLIPHGHTHTSLHTGSSLHHSLAAEGIEGVRQALATELKTPDGRLQRYVYVQLEPDADAAAIEQAIRRDPLYLDEETLVFLVDSVAELEEADRGLLLERHAAAGEPGHAALLVEARVNETAMAARVMLAAT